MRTNLVFAAILCVLTHCLGCAALNVPKNKKSYADEPWVYPDPSRMQMDFKIPDAGGTVQETSPKDGLRDWVNDGKEDWRLLKEIVRVVNGY